MDVEPVTDIGGVLIMNYHLTVVAIPEGDHEYWYFIGVELARFLLRKSFNMYRCLRRKKVPLLRLGDNNLKKLASRKKFRSNIHSATLVPYKTGLEYIGRHIKKMEDNAVRILENRFV